MNAIKSSVKIGEGIKAKKRHQQAASNINGVNNGGISSVACGEARVHICISVRRRRQIIKRSVA